MRPARGEPLAVVEVLRVVAVALVERSDRLEGLAGDRESGARRPVDGAAREAGRRPPADPEARPAAQAARQGEEPEMGREGAAAPLRQAVRVDEARRQRRRAARPAGDPRSKASRIRWSPPSVTSASLFSSSSGSPVASARPRLTAALKPRASGLRSHRQAWPRVAEAGPAQELDAGIGRAVVHHEDLERRRPAGERGEALRREIGRGCAPG